MLIRIGFILLSLAIVTVNSDNVWLPVLMAAMGMMLMKIGERREDAKKDS